MTEQRVRNGAMILVRDRGVELRKGAELELQCESSVLLAQPMNKIKDWLSMQDTNADQMEVAELGRDDVVPDFIDDRSHAQTQPGEVGEVGGKSSNVGQCELGRHSSQI